LQRRFFSLWCSFSLWNGIQELIISVKSSVAFLSNADNPNSNNVRVVAKRGLGSTHSSL
jgi:hypothetical protein